MSFTYNLATPIGKVRLLIGDTISASAKFSDEEIQAFLDFEDGSVYLAAADALDSQAASAAASDTASLTLGDYSVSNKNTAANLQTQAQRLRDLENNKPAFAVVEENLSEFNQFEIIRNYILRCG